MNPVLAALTVKKREFGKLYLSIDERNNDPKSTPNLDKIHELATQSDVKIKWLSRRQFGEFSGIGKDRPH